MNLERKSEIVTEILVNALKEMNEKYGQEIVVSFNADYLSGNISIKVKK